MVIIKCNAALPDDQRRHLEINLHDQAADGVIVLPYFCDLLTVTPDSEEIKIVQQDNRVAELEAELAAAIKYISAQKDCNACAHNYEPKHCNDDYCTRCPEKSCPCNSCYGFSNWKWRGTHGTE